MLHPRKALIEPLSSQLYVENVSDKETPSWDLPTELEKDYKKALTAHFRSFSNNENNPKTKKYIHGKIAKWNLPKLDFMEVISLRHLARLLKRKRLAMRGKQKAKKLLVGNKK